MVGGMADEDPLIARAAAGDARAFRDLYERHRTDVARLAARMLDGRSDLEDIIQEVFVQVHKSIKYFRGDAKFGTWLHRVTVNVVLMHRRAAKSRPAFSSSTVDVAITDTKEIRPDEDVERRQRVRAFARLLDRLADKKRIVFVLHELEGMAPDEIAKVVGAPVLTVRTRLFYARRELEAMLSQEPTLSGLGVEFSNAARARGTTP
jgi:RNA polymerase sigma-70 factor (ECF subfamily)